MLETLNRKHSIGETVRMWRPGLLAFLEAMQSPTGWTFDAGGFDVGIDNVHVDVHLSPRFRELSVLMVRNLIAEDLLASMHQAPVQLVSAADFERFRRRYMRLFESALERDRSAFSSELFVLLQLALLRWMLGLAERENRSLQQHYQRTPPESPRHDEAHADSSHGPLELLQRQGPAINRRVLKLLFRQVRRLESGPLSKLRGSVSTDAWPFPQQAFFNPALLVPAPDDAGLLAVDYPVVRLGEDEQGRWLQLANQTLVGVFGAYLPDFCRGPASGEKAPRDRSSTGHGQRDPWLLSGLIGSELLLSRFLSDEEYRSGQVSWLDEPANLRRFLHPPQTESESASRAFSTPEQASGDASPVLWPTRWASPHWQAFRRDTRALLHARLEQAGAAERIVLCYWLLTLHAEVGAALPFSLLVDHCVNRHPRQALAARLTKCGVDRETGMQALDQARDGLRRMRKLPEFGAEKLFVEGDAVILALYEYASQADSASGLHPVARACSLASRILQLVARQNVQNRDAGLPELELGLGIAFSPREPHFLYDEGRRIVISPAINRADRLSSNAPALRAAGIFPLEKGQRVLVVRDASAAASPNDAGELIAFNVNGIHLEQAAFFALRREISMRQTRLSVRGDEDALYFLGDHSDGFGREHRVAVRCASVRDWDGHAVGGVEPKHRHYFEVIADETIATALHKLPHQLDDSGIGWQWHCPPPTK